MTASPKIDETRILIYGAGTAGAMIGREIVNDPAQGLELVVYADDDPEKTGGELQGVPIAGGIAELPEIINQYEIEEVLIAMPSASGDIIRKISDVCIDEETPYRVLPGIFEIIHGDAFLNQIREIEYENLLKREPIELDLEAISGKKEGRTVLVTGAGGSIGSELCRQLTSFKPRSILMLGHGENSIYEIANEMAEKYPGLPTYPLISSVCDRAKVRRFMEKYRPEIVFQAAAHKHVPLMEVNIEEAIKNNVTGTRVMAEEAQNSGAEQFVLISTDKAVNPVNAMGASKMIAELFVQSIPRKGRTRYITVRFGNVMGSRGSVINLFKRQIAAGGPVTVTHPDVTRYFMTTYEAVQLVIQASAIGEDRDIMILDMGQPIRIEDLALDLIRLSGKVPEKDIAIEYIGLKPGERLYEELFTNYEDLKATEIDEIMAAVPLNINAERIIKLVNAIEEAAAQMDTVLMLDILRDLVPTYDPDRYIREL